MKTKTLFAAFMSILAITAACKENEIKYEDSPFISVRTPLKGEHIEDTDSVRVEAKIIQNEGIAIKNLFVWLIDSKKRLIYEQKWPCNCKGEKVVTLRGAFLQDVNKTSDLILHVDAELENGNVMLEEVPFKLVDAGK